MATIKLTKKVVDSLPTPSTPYERHFDSDLTGFHVKVTGRGKKVFGVKGAVNGKPKWITLGTYPALTVDQARKMALEELGKLAQGVDPTEVKAKAQIEATTLNQAFEDFKAARDLKPNTISIYTRGMALLGWGSKPLVSITRDDVYKKYQALCKDHGDAFANSAMRSLRAVISFASEKYRVNDKPLIAENPVRVLSGLKAWKKVDRRETFIAPHELKAWWEACNQLTEEVTRDYLRFVLFTGLRRNEAATLKWADINLEAKTFTITETKNGEPHTLPLTDHLLTILEARRAARINEWVFPSEGSKSGHLEEPKRACSRIEQLCGVKATIHDLRRTFITIAESLDIPAYSLKALLNHKTAGDVTAGYIQVTPERLRGPMQRITDFVLKQVGENAPAQVIDFPTNKISNL